MSSGGSDEMSLNPTTGSVWATAAWVRWQTGGPANELGVPLKFKLQSFVLNLSLPMSFFDGHLFAAYVRASWC